MEKTGGGGIVSASGSFGSCTERKNSSPSYSGGITMDFLFLLLVELDCTLKEIMPCTCGIFIKIHVPD